MGHKCFISFKAEDIAYKLSIQTQLNIDMIDKSLDAPINSDNEDYILQTIRKNYLSDSTVTIHLIGANSAESFGWNEQRYIKRELQASLYNIVRMDDEVVVKEFSYNYYIPNGKCCHTEDERYCVLCTWAEFCANPEKYIDDAYAKRSVPIAKKVKVYGK